MATKEKKTYPTIPNAQWWALRKKFHQSIPGEVTPSYLSAALNMKARSASVNVMPGLRQVGLIDQDNKSTPLARKWRDDETYKAVCSEIRSSLYPKELLDAAPDPVNDRKTAERWFANVTGGGAVAVRKMAAFYALLTEGDPSKAAGKREGKSPSPKATAPRRKLAPAPAPMEERVTPKPHGSHDAEAGPCVHINLQVHISPDATPEQIDQVFVSIGKHIYKKGTPE